MYRRHGRRVLAYALRRAPVESAQDAVADAFLAAWRRLDELPDDPLPWLIGATRRTLANQRRAAARQARLGSRLRGEPARVDIAPEALDPEVARALRSLSPRDRESLALIAWDGLTPAQAARALGCSAAAFRVRLHRARRRFERALAEGRDGVGWREPARPKEAS